MKNKKLFFSSIAMAIFIIILGTLLHFTYDLSNKSTIFTYFPPKIGIFKDPISSSYGIPK